MAIYSLFSPVGQATKAIDIESDIGSLTESSDMTFPSNVNFFLNGGLRFFKEGDLVTLIPGEQDSPGQFDAASLGSNLRLLTTNMSYTIGAPPPPGFYNPDKIIETYFLVLYVDSNGMIQETNNIAFYQDSSGSLIIAPSYIDISPHLSELNKVIFIPIKNSYII